MVEYINLKKLIELKNKVEYMCYDLYDLEDFLADVKKECSADVVEVVHGEWKQNPYCKRIYYCSICGRHIEDCTGNYKEHFPYCHCGAKMD